MMAKKRFGISLDESLAASIDLLSDKLGVNRSRLIEEAIRNYLEDHSHLLVPHRCRGVIVATCPSSWMTRRVAEDYKEVINAWLHAHVQGECVEMLVVEGETDEIAKLYSTVKKMGCRSRYIPTTPEPAKSAEA